MRTNQAADDVAHLLQLSSDLVNWVDGPADIPLLSATNHGDGTATLVYQSAAGMIGSRPRRFVRVRFTLIP